MPEDGHLAHSDSVDDNRRDFLFVATGSMAAVGVAAVVWPLIDQMNPDASVLSLASTEVDLEPIEVGQAITVMWRGKPVFIRRRTGEEIEAARATPLDDLPDPLADNANLPASAPATDVNRVIDGNEQWLVLVGVCTHLGCVPKGQSIGDARGDYGGWFCPCHGSHYDTAGRIRKGPAPKNLAVPPYVYESDTRIKIG
jgi:ubiquinol-cytochrome c reductase iron-sulfur subunit